MKLVKRTKLKIENTVKAPNKSKENGFENCVCCGKKTSIPKNTPIPNREYYLAGAGQLCKECYAKLSRAKDN